MPPGRLEDAARSHRYLSLLERQRIATLRGQGLGVREIARRLDRAPSTVSRELVRNMLRHDGDRYDGDLAHARARDRTRRPRGSRLLADGELAQVVQDKLKLEWSPQQIAAHLRLTYPDRPAWHVCHETIYQALYNGSSGLSRTLTRRLRTGRPLRKRRRRPDRRKIRFVVPSVLIEHRPAIVAERARVGDWEGDLIVGRMSRSAIGTLVDRTTRYVRLVHLPHGHNADQLVTGMLTTLGDLPEHVRRTLTWDQGSEMARHDLLADHFTDGIYFAEPGSPWQRGTNENTNGLLRQYFPKGTDLNIYDAQALRDVEERLNNRPRRTLGWKAPIDVFTPALAR
ncbi:IS30 family transposase [Cellulomonas sp. WB94]|nr:IS30 family transposase [Cellulomonas sp. WB94]